MYSETSDVMYELDHKQREINFTDLNIDYSELMDDDSDVYEKRIQEELYKFLNVGLNNLPQRHEQVLRLRFYDKLTRKEIGVIMGVTSVRIAQIEHTAIRNMRHSLVAPVIKELLE